MRRSLRHRLSSGLGLAAIIVAMLASTLLFDRLLSGLRIDLTERDLHTLSPHARKLFADLQTPITLTLYFSGTVASGLPGLGDHARYVTGLLERAAAASQGRLTIERVDPRPFSPEEDAAAAAGLQSVPISRDGDEVWLGIVGRTEDGRHAVLPFLQPERERFLEYEIARLVDELARPGRPRIALVSGLPVDGETRPGGGRVSRWAFVDLLESRFEVSRPDLDGEDALDGADALVLIHPHDLSAAARFAIDRFVLAGHPALVFVDPNAELDPAANQSPFPSDEFDRSSELDDLLGAWGVRLVAGRVLLDAAAALPVDRGPGRAPVRHLAMAGYGPEHFAADDVVVADLSRVNVSTAGALEPVAGAGTRFEPLITSGADSQLVDARRVRVLPDPASLARDFVADPHRHVLMARVHGPARSAFADPQAPSAARPSGDIQVLVVADTDLLTDGLWVTVEPFYGQNVATPWASNGDLVVNAVDNLAGSPDLIGMRGRGGFSRPFERVEAMRRAAEREVLGRAEALQARLEETEARLAELEAQQDRPGSTALDQLTAIRDFQAQRQRLRVELREVQRRLTADVEALGTRLKLLDTLAVPALLALIGLLLALRPRRRARTPASPH